MAKIFDLQNIKKRIGFFADDLKTTALKTDFTKILESQKGNWSSIKTELIKDDRFTPNLIGKLEMTHFLSDWSNDNATLVKVFQDNPKTNSMREIAIELDKPTFLKTFETAAPVKKEAKEFSVNQYNKLFNLEPSGVLINLIRDKNVPQLESNVFGNVASILEKNIDFNIKTTSIYKVLKSEDVFKNIPSEAHDTVSKQLKTLQRIITISPIAEAVPVLYQEKLHTSNQIAQVPHSQFMGAMKGKGLEDNILQQIHTNAQYSKARNEQALMQLKEAGQKTGVAFIDRSLSIKEPISKSGASFSNMSGSASNMSEATSLMSISKSPEELAIDTLQKNDLSWDLLFGDADFCECGECTSVYSASSYFVELLQYLRNNNLEKDAIGTIVIKTNPKDISDTPLEKLFDRRPDLGCLELTCKNTNTILPYIDLVNEVMESYVVHKKELRKIIPYNVEDETSAELLAEAQHTEYKAYCILQKEVFPFTLPYHQPIDATRIYLKSLETSRYEVLKSFRRNNNGSDAELTKLKNKALSRASDAEYLGLTLEEYVILTKECFEDKELMGILKNKTYSDDEYQKHIGVKEVHEYYGYEKPEGLERLPQIKKEFLRRTGIDYFNLVDLLKTEYLNPNMPRGKSKAIMESLRFSYRFLQNYAKLHGINKMAEDLVKLEMFADIFPKLKEIVAILTNQLVTSELSCPSSCVDKYEITAKEISHWVKCHFEKVGKIIVIESGRGCVNGEIEIPKRGKNLKIIVEECKIYFINEKIKREIGSINKNSGKISLITSESSVVTDITEFTQFRFLGSKGEKGRFYVIENELFLIFLEQKDSCDLNSAILQHLDGSPLTDLEYDKIHRFIRLWRKLDWTIDETDKAIVGLSVKKASESQSEAILDESVCDDCNANCGEDCGDCSCDGCEDDTMEHQEYEINPNLIFQLGAVKKLLDRSGIELIQLLAFWADISTSGEKSLYERLFLKHNIKSIDDVFKANGQGNYLSGTEFIKDHYPVLMAAFNLSSDDIDDIRNATNLDANDAQLTVPNLSVFCRYRLLSKILGLKIPAFINILPIFGKVFKNAQETLRFLRIWTKMEESGFTHQQLNYILRDFDDIKRPFEPTEKSVLQLAKTIYDGLNSIDETHQDLSPDAIITDEELKKINVQEKATVELVRAKLSLLYDPLIIERIIGYLEGTTVYLTNAPIGMVFELSETSSLKKKLKYDKIEGLIQILGILTETETIEYKTLSNDPEWLLALVRIEKQQKKQFKEVLSGVFENEKGRIPSKKSFVEFTETTIKSGDIKTFLVNIPEGQADTNTAPQKRVEFLKVFLPYLRQELTRRFVVDTLSNTIGLDQKITDVLISEVLKIGNSDETIYHVFEKIKDSTKPTQLDWNGYLVPSKEDNYIIIIKKSNSTPSLSVNGKLLSFERQEDPTNEWWSETLTLKAGQLYKFRTVGIEMKNVYWKTTASSITSIPLSALIPDFASDAVLPAFIALKKATILVSTFNISADEITFLENNKESFDDINFSFFDKNNSEGDNSKCFSLGHWLRLDAYSRLRNSLPQSKINILDFWEWTSNINADVAKLSEKIAELTSWKKERIDKLIANSHFNINSIQDFRNEKNLLKLQKTLLVADKIGMDINLLFDWAKPTSNFNKCRAIADSIKNSIKAKYKQTDWEVVVKPLHDELRNNQKNALIAYLLQQQELIDFGVTDAEGLFEYFLIDVQMDSCMETSRIKQGISSLQLFIQRCFLGLEEEYSGIKNNVLDRLRWEWMQRYRVWEANRKVFLYPENWIESNLRDDKSPFFKELESELLQKDISKQNVTDALKAYLYKVDEVANLEVVGLYIENEIYDNKPVNKLHVFSRTRNAPYFFFYRYFDVLEKNWYPWEKMQVDIPSYDVEQNGQILSNGCYLTPVAWNSRLFIFFPQFIKKTEPSNIKIRIGTGSERNMTAKELSENEISSLDPSELWEIKMAFCELKNGKWTQKQLSKKAIYDFGTYSSAITKGNPQFTVTIRGKTLTDISKYSFVPKVTSDLLEISLYGSARNKVNGFTFDGANLEIGSSLPSNFAALPSNFHYHTDNKIYTLQTTANQISNFSLAPNVSRGNSINPISLNDNIGFTHRFTNSLLNLINLGRLTNFFEYSQSPEVGALKNEAFGLFDPDNNSATKNSIYNELKQPYSIYNWELFLHTPIMLADALSKAQQFEEAMKWFHYVFNPMAEGNDDKRFWQFQPFKEVNSQRILESIFSNLAPNKAEDTINEWRNKPFMPHVVARSRPVAYMKWVVMKYLDNLLAWGDYLYRQDTIESINQATQLYILAWHILGERPMMIPKRGKVRPQTYIGLLDKWDAFGNAVVELELAAPFSSQTSLPISSINGELAFANIYGSATSLYFCIPNNPKLMGYWDTITDRLFKIRHCQNIQGIFRKLPLFEPPIDPALLVNAAANGLSIGSVINDLNTPMPNYRFYYLLQKALELCGELKSLGTALLSAIEKQDNESISLIRAKHEKVMQNLVMEIKKKQLEDAQSSLENLGQNRIAPVERMKYYLKLTGLDENLIPNETTTFAGISNEIVIVDGDSGLKLIPFEKEDMDRAKDAQGLQDTIGKIESLASVFHAIPTIGVCATPLGVGGQMQWGGPNLGNVTQAIAKWMSTDAAEHSYASSSAGKKGGFQRALQERIFQANAAGYEIKQIDKQIVSQKIRIDIANQELLNHQKQIDNSQEIEEFLKNKYTNEELYSWMKGNLKTLYHQVYSMAYELAKKSEKVYRFERGLTTSNFIQAGYWDAGRDGLLAGEKLYVGLKQLEAAYQNERGYDYEITKHISLRQINPLAVMELRETGKCEFALSEVLFDMDFPGHFKRRIKSVSVSIPSIAGPYTGINATMRLLENKFRNNAIGGKNYEEDTEEADDRFSTFVIPISAIATSSAQNDSGMFELNFKDERYLPFEGAGTTSKWRLELPSFKQFDYNTISDVVIHVRYTSSEGGERLKEAAKKSVNKFIKNNDELARNEGVFSIIDLKHDLSTEWHKATTIQNEAGVIEIDLSKIDQFLPYYTVLNDKKLKATNVIVLNDIGDSGFILNEEPLIGGPKIGSLKAPNLSEQSLKIENWKLRLPSNSKEAKQMIMILKLKLE